MLYINPITPIHSLPMPFLPNPQRMAFLFQKLAFFSLSFLQFALHKILVQGWESSDPTKGFISLPLNRSYYHIQKPYDLPENQRYCFSDGVHRCWVYSTDKPHTPTSQTKPRTEIAIQVIKIS